MLLEEARLQIAINTTEIPANGAEGDTISDSVLLMADQPKLGPVFVESEGQDISEGRDGSGGVVRGPPVEDGNGNQTSGPVHETGSMDSPPAPQPREETSRGPDTAALASMDKQANAERQKEQEEAGADA